MDSVLRSYKGGYLWLAEARSDNTAGYYVRVLTPQDAAELLQRCEDCKRHRQSCQGLACHQYYDYRGQYYEDENTRLDMGLATVHQSSNI
ncbi:MAG: hypothetical protein KatS3mg082_1402 [Nitrospiraceae bacterium]|nr:MAG: hypothetical protein KatS3mg082_1402 [Nitrospiraceae bacterium]